MLRQSPRLVPLLYLPTQASPYSRDHHHPPRPPSHLYHNLTPLKQPSPSNQFSTKTKPPQTKKMATSQAELTGEFEKAIKRNPHPDFKKVEASRPPWDTTVSPRYTQTANPTWKFGDGANAPSSTPHISIDPYAEGRPAGFNYKLLISAITPRPIALLSTRSADGKITNLAPFSYFNLIGHDPPLFIIGFVGAVSSSFCKDSLKNLSESKECVINIISEDFIEAANSTSINAPYGVSEWDVSGLTPAYDCETVQVARVKEAVFAIEGKLESAREFESRAVPGKMGSTLVVIEGTRFWAREDAVNEERSSVDLSVLRPMARLGGITYSRQVEALEVPRPSFVEDLGGLEGAAKLEKKELPN